MNYFDLISSYPDRTITAAWDSQVNGANQIPWLAELLRKRGYALFPRFARCYTELRSKPRSARRALQCRIARSSELAAIFPDWLKSETGRVVRLKLARSLAGAALLLALSQEVATAATINVTTKDPRISPDGQCSLIEAIVNANADSAFFADCPPGSGSDTILLPSKANLRLMDTHDDSYGPTGLPLITSPITIEGNGATIRRQGQTDFRLIAVSNAGELTLRKINLSNGSSSNGGGVFNKGILVIQESTISGNRASWGAGVANYGTVAIENSTISNNRYGGGVSNGGRVFLENRPISNSNPNPETFCFYYSGYSYWFYYYPPSVSCFKLYSGALTIADSTVSKNSAGGGGGVLNYLGTVSIANSTISGNKGFWGGGAFNSGGSFDHYGKYIPAGEMSLTDSTIAKNFAHRGAGVFNQGTLTIENSALSRNRASEDGAGIFNASNDNAPAGDLSLVDSTISKNRARHAGGGLFNDGSLSITNSTISGNKARTGPDVFP